METITTLLSKQHQVCDVLFAQAEQAVAAQNWTLAVIHFNAFHDATADHFSREEQVLFPAFENITGNSQGATSVMRFEHTHLRDLFEQMKSALNQQDSDEYLGLSESFLMLIRQHNAKEEQMLYPMADRALINQHSELLTYLK
jgi:hemerythrin-like domain-containing protein